MALPAKRQAKSRSRVRRSAIRLKRVVLTVCPKCGRLVKPHRACAFCGTYRNKGIIRIRIKKGSKRAKEEKQAKKNKK